MVGSSRLGSDAISRNRRAGGRLLQRLQQRVGGVDVELVGGIDDHHAPGALRRRQPQERLEPPHLVDGDARRDPLGAHVVGPAQHQQPRMRQRADLARGGVSGAISRLCPAGSRSLAAPARAAPDDRPASPCRSPPARRAARRDACGRRQRPAPAPARRPRGRQGARLARVREALEAVGLGQRLVFLQCRRAGHQGTPRKSRRSTWPQISAAIVSGAPAPSTITQRCGSASAMAR